MSEKNIDDLQSIFRKVFGQDNLVLTESMTAADVAAWDSLTHIELIIAIEQEFGVKFGLGELQAMKNVGDLIASLKKKNRF